MRTQLTTQPITRQSAGQKPHIGRFSAILKWLYSLIADGNGTGYSYSKDGKIEKRTWARGITTTYSYTNTGELVGIDYSDDTPDITFTVDRIGRQVTVTDAQGTRTFGYDPDTLQLTNEVIVAGSVTNIITRTQDSLGRNVGLALRANGSDVYDVDYGFDNRGRFLGLVATNGGVEVANVTYSYIENSDLIAGISNSVTSAVSARDYENNRNLLTSVANRHGSTLISGFVYTNDEIGRRTLRLDSTLSTVNTNIFGFNTRSELTSAVMDTNNFSYVFDQIGSRIIASEPSAETSYIANELNQYSSITNNGSPITTAHDADGNMVTNGSWTYTWNAENRMITASNSSMTATYNYDYMGRRFEKTVVTNSVTTTNTFIYDGWNLIQETSGTNVTRYVWGLDLSGSMQGAGGIGGLLCVIENGTPYYPCVDGNGNITDYLDTNGTVVAHYEYGPFGQIIAKSGDKADDFKFRFSSKYFDDETGLYYYGYRMYSPELGRWIKRDSIGERGGFNLSEFLRNRVIDLIDSLGNAPDDNKSLCERALADFKKNNAKLIESLKEDCDIDLQCSCCKPSTGSGPCPRGAPGCVNDLTEFKPDGITPRGKRKCSGTVCFDVPRGPGDSTYSSFQHVALHEFGHLIDCCKPYKWDCNSEDNMKKYDWAKGNAFGFERACNCAKKMCNEIRAVSYAGWQQDPSQEDHFEDIWNYVSSKWWDKYPECSTFLVPPIGKDQVKELVRNSCPWQAGDLPKPQAVLNPDPLR